ncbi:C13 family peptidase [Gilvimarinus xylanilyticus]|uniref:Caspase family protein n=1 Tax=Gilvimarinus xylanilyticus TaxID=2944139 RepID=A0A9X2HSW9_9GAMM|nr:C13 family peptidase [Gilvimarinus xylanilyticus]MCP8897948.1 caspase family protein [Gilvimarinus xylanilyticus]
MSKLLLCPLLLVLSACSHLNATSVEDYPLPDGSSYTGELSDGLMNGEGTIEWPNGDVYTGELQEGVIHGKGELVTESGEVFRGWFKQGLLNGAGEWLGPDDVTYKGEFKDDAFHGEGVYASPEGAYAGDFVEGELTGLGTFTSTDGTDYAGEFKAWRFEGNGVWEDGETRYTGEFKSGLYHGYGERIDLATGKVLEAGQWKWGQFVGEPVSKAERRRQQLAIETALFNQPARLHDAFDSLTPSQPDTVDLFALIGAGDGTQKVFSLESQTIAKTIQADRVSPGHLLTLSNYPGTMDQAPLLTLRNLQQLIKALAEHMQSDDVLLLYLTSHGSAEHEFSLEAPGHGFVDITPGDLSDALEPLKDNPKILMISACYSGGFIEPLKAPHHLIMTAARADRTSFGCGDADTMTYFGRAYFEKALPDSNSFIEAFEVAKKHIEIWEDEQEVDHSEPQIFVGDDVGPALQGVW